MLTIFRGETTTNHLLLNVNTMLNVVFTLDNVVTLWPIKTISKIVYICSKRLTNNINLNMRIKIKIVLFQENRYAGFTIILNSHINIDQVTELNY